MFQREKKIHALKDVSFQIQKGEVVGYVGTNGSGKSTTIKILTGILRPTSGEVTVQGRDPFKYRKKCLEYRCSFWSKISIMVGFACY